VQKIGERDVQRRQRVGDHICCRPARGLNLQLVGDVLVSGGDDVKKPLALRGIHHIREELGQHIYAGDALRTRGQSQYKIQGFVS
jgi:hypothetical protein